MTYFFIGLIIGTLSGILLGSIYDSDKITKIVEYTILSYRVKEEEARQERIRQFIDDTKEGE